MEHHFSEQGREIVFPPLFPLGLAAAISLLQTWGLADCEANQGWAAAGMGLLLTAPSKVCPSL